MLRIIIVAILAYVAWRYYGWHGAVAVIAAYVILSALLWIVSKVGASSAKRVSQQHAGSKLSEAEKAHYAATREHQQAMHEHKAQFDPDARKSSGH